MEHARLIRGRYAILIPDRLTATYSALGGGWPLAFEFDGTPHPQARIQVAKGRAYRPDEKDQRELRKLLRVLHEGEPLTGSVVLCAAFYLPDRRTRDTDNMLKHLGDSANGILWADDRQVTGMAGYAELDRERPRTVVLYGADDLTTLRR